MKANLAFTTAALAISSVHGKTRFFGRQSEGNLPVDPVVGAPPTNLAPGSLTPANGCSKYVTIAAGQKCYDILEAPCGWGIADFYATNPSVHHGCKNLTVGQAYCIEGPTSVWPGARSPHQGCNGYYTVAAGDTCSSIITGLNSTFTLPDLYEWNHGLNRNCTNLVVGDAYCVSFRHHSSGSSGGGWGRKHSHPSSRKGHHSLPNIPAPSNNQSPPYDPSGPSPNPSLDDDCDDDEPTLVGPSSDDNCDDNEPPTPTDPSNDDDCDDDQPTDTVSHHRGGHNGGGNEWSHTHSWSQPTGTVSHHRGGHNSGGNGGWSHSLSWSGSHGHRPTNTHSGGHHGGGRGHPHTTSPEDCDDEPTPTSHHGGGHRPHSTTSPEDCDDEPTPTPTHRGGNSSGNGPSGDEDCDDEPTPTPTHRGGNSGGNGPSGDEDCDDEPTPTPTHRGGNSSGNGPSGDEDCDDEPTPTPTHRGGNSGGNGDEDCEDDYSSSHHSTNT